MAIRTVAVIDIGKTNAKVALVDLPGLAEISVRRTPNAVLREGPYPHHDVERLWAFILDSLTDLGRSHAVDAISITTHGATAALVDAQGGLALPVLDYEHGGPDETRADYRQVRPDFAETGSPELPMGLNLGAQLFWQQARFAEGFSRTAAILPYPQYWAFRLTGAQASEATSLGCHTDLWRPYAGDFSAMVDALGWRGLFPPVKPANAVIGGLTAEAARLTGLAPGLPVACGIHDSNASLVAHILRRTPPFSVVSTGTWVVSMAVDGTRADLDPARDTLVNVSALGRPTPSARFMGGREYEMLGAPATATPAEAEAVLSDRIALLPSVQPGCGPFPGRTARWTGRTPTQGEEAAAVAFYLALMTATCLELIGAAGETVVEGPFAENGPYIDMLAAATGRPVVTQAGRSTGTSIGAALLFDLGSGPAGTAAGGARSRPAPEWTRYAADWMAAVRGG